MSDLNAQFHFSLARITTTQLLRSAGVDRAKPSVIDSLTDLLIRHISLLAESSKTAAELAGRHKCELEDLREACEALGAISTTHCEGVREEEGVLKFISWCMSDDATQMRTVAGEGRDELGDDVSANWLGHLIQKQIKVTGEDRVKETVLAASTMRAVGSDTERLSEPAVETVKRVEGLESLNNQEKVPDVVKEYAKAG